MKYYKLVLLWVVCLSYEVVMTGCEVVWVHRNVTDSFCLGKNGCTNDKSVCPSKAECQPDGSCLCDANNPNFRNPVIQVKEDGAEIVYGDSYGCVDNSIISFRAVEASFSLCPFVPFQVIPYSHEGPVTKFLHHDHVFNCSLTKALVKFPDNATELELQWLDESFVDFNILNRTMYFKWRRSVPDLQGTIIIFNRYCAGPSSTGQGSLYYQHKCLQAKILGTWKAVSIMESTASLPTEPTVSSTKMKSSPTTPVVTLPATRKTTAIPKPTVCSCSDENSSDLSKVFIALFSICIVVIIVLGMIVGYLWKNRQRIKDKNMQVKELKNIDGNMDETSVYDEVVHSGVHNDGMNEETVSKKDNNGRLSDHKYEEPSNYEPLKRNPLQDENEEHKYQSLTTSQK